MNRKHVVIATVIGGFVFVFLVMFLIIALTPPAMAAILSLLWPAGGVLFYVLRWDVKLANYIDSVKDNDQL